MSRTTGITLTAMSMIIVPATTGVKSLRMRESRDAKNDGGRNDQGGHEAGAAVHQGRDADSQKCAGRAHYQNVSGANVSNSDGLQSGCCAADDERCKDCP